MTGVLARWGKAWPAWGVLAVVMLAVLPFMSLSSWITLTIAGAAMGMMLFLMASGLTLVFGLMDVLNFAHGGYITLGAFLAVSILARLSGWAASPLWLLGLAALLAALAGAAVVAGAVGWVFERLLVRRVHGSHLQQILITAGGLIVMQQLILALWGAQPLQVARPAFLSGSILLGGAAIETVRLAAVVLGLAVFAGLQLVLARSRVGLLVRAGVENREMVEALGYRIRRLFVGVFVAGAMLAAVGGVMWALYQQQVTASIGGDMTVLVFVVVIIGGLGSVPGCFAGAVLVGLVANYVGFLAPPLALGSNIALMTLLLLWRPRGLLPLGGGA